MSVPEPFGTCDAGDCERIAVTWIYEPRLDVLIPSCRQHLQTYRVCDGRWWQCEDEAYDLRFARRSRFKALAQMKLLHDQRVAARGRVSLAQRFKTWKAER